MVWRRVTWRITNKHIVTLHDATRTIPATTTTSIKNNISEKGRRLIWCGLARRTHQLTWSSEWRSGYSIYFVRNNGEDEFIRSINEGKKRNMKHLHGISWEISFCFPLFWLLTECLSGFKLYTHPKPMIHSHACLLLLWELGVYATRQK